MDVIARDVQRTFAATGRSEGWAEAVAKEVLALSEGSAFHHARHALEKLVRQEIRVLVDGGSAGIPIDEVAMNLARANVTPQKAATALLLAAVAVGGGIDGSRPAWQHMQEPGNTTRSGATPSHPVRGVGSPTGARSLYNLAIGEPGAPGRVATAARGPADRR